MTKLDKLEIKIPDNFVFPFCDCGGVLSAKLATNYLVCLSCNKEFSIQEIEHD